MQRVIATKNGEVRLFLYLMFDEKLTSNIMFLMKLYGIIIYLNALLTNYSEFTKTSVLNILVFYGPHMVQCFRLFTLNVYFTCNFPTAHVIRVGYISY